MTALYAVGYTAAALVGLPLFALAVLVIALHVAPAAVDRALRRWLPKQEIRPGIYNNHFDIKDDRERLDGGGIVPGQEVYIRRYYLTPANWSRKLFLHNIRLSDRDRAAHNHQWPFNSLILVGKYIEHIFFPNACACGDLKCGRRYRIKHAPAGTLLLNKPEHTHLVEIVKPVWSLVFVGKKVQSWGFWLMVEMPGRRHGDRNDAPPDRFVPWDEYLKVTKSASGEDSRKSSSGKANA